jgi:hypothetical protein
MIAAVLASAESNNPRRHHRKSVELDPRQIEGNKLVESFKHDEDVVNNKEIKLLMIDGCVHCPEFTPLEFINLHFFSFLFIFFVYFEQNLEPTTDDIHQISFRHRHPN